MKFSLSKEAEQPKMKSLRGFGGGMMKSKKRKAAAPPQTIPTIGFTGQERFRSITQANFNPALLMALRKAQLGK